MAPGLSLWGLDGKIGEHTVCLPGQLLPDPEDSTSPWTYGERRKGKKAEAHEKEAREGAQAENDQVPRQGPKESALRPHGYSTHCFSGDLAA